VAHWFDLEVSAQPDDSTCGPTCLHGVYRYYGLDRPLEQVIRDVPSLEGGGTLAVLLGTEALHRGFEATLFVYNLLVFDPTWAALEPAALVQKLKERRAAKTDPKLRTAIDAYLHFLELGGRLRFENLTPALLRRFLKQRIPIMTGLSATFLYQSAREIVVDGRLLDDDVHGDPQGHFVVLSGYDPATRSVKVSDPLRPNPFGSPEYVVDLFRLLNAIMLGVVTYDANLLVIRPADEVE